MRERNQRAAWGRIGGLTTSARLGGVAMTAPARRGFWRRFEREVDPDGRLNPAERSKRANQLMRAHMLRLAKSSAEVRSSKASVSSDPTVCPPVDRRD